jgi:hypothetical protein
MQRVKAHELRQRDERALVDDLTKYRVRFPIPHDLHTERTSSIESQQGLRCSPSQVGPYQSKHIYYLLIALQSTRKAIAKVLTVINEKRRDKSRADNSKKKYTPLDLRFKKTRAFRKRLTKFERNSKPLTVQKRLANFRERKFALPA